VTSHQAWNVVIFTSVAWCSSSDLLREESVIFPVMFFPNFFRKWLIYSMCSKYFNINHIVPTLLKTNVVIWLVLREKSKEQMFSGNCNYLALKVKISNSFLMIYITHIYNSYDIIEICYIEI